MSEREQPLSDHPFCQQEQEPDQIDMMSENELRTEFRKLVKTNVAQSCEGALLREAVDDFIAQIKDCKARHTVCGQLTSLSKVVQENLDAPVSEGQTDYERCKHGRVVGMCDECRNDATV